jgi:hypothetical protein
MATRRVPDLRQARHTAVKDVSSAFAEPRVDNSEVSVDMWHSHWLASPRWAVRTVYYRDVSPVFPETWKTVSIVSGPRNGPASMAFAKRFACTSVTFAVGWKQFGSTPAAVPQFPILR